ncbi:MAG: hypothetical protein ABSA97_16315 [Verrucomicrobiia bacterium]
MAAEYRAKLAGVQGVARGNGREDCDTFCYAFRRVFGNPLVIILVAAAAFYGVYKFADEWIQKLKELMEKKQ